MTRPYQILILPLALALGFGVGRIIKSHSSETLSAETESGSSAPRDSQFFEQKISYWRERALQLLEEESTALQIASYYAFARELSVEDMAYAVEGMYPEGWTRFRGDLPLAIFMEWAKRDVIGLALFTARFFERHPDLEDNFEGVYYNLGLQNAPGAVDTVAAFPEALSHTAFASEFISGLGEHPNSLFDARLKILGPKTAFGAVDHDELEKAATAFWANAQGYLNDEVRLDPAIALELGKRYPEQSVHIFDATPEFGYAITGAIVTERSLSKESQERFNSTWLDWDTLSYHLSDDEAHTILAYLSRQTDYWKSNPSQLSYSLISDALDRELAEALLSNPLLPDQTRNLVVANASAFFTQDEYLGILSKNEAPTRTVGLQSLLREKTPTERLSLLQQLPVDWLTKPILDDAFNNAVFKRDRETFAQLCETFSTSHNYLPSNPEVSSMLWEMDPELYLKNIESIDAAEKKYHLNMIASNAAEEELGLILESGSFDQQTDVLINLIRNNPLLSTEILKNENPTLFSSPQASALGNALAQIEDQAIALSYFQASDIQREKNQVSVLNFYSTKILEESDLDFSQEVAALSPKHDYLYRATKAFYQETDDPAALESLRSEDPKTFLKALTTLIKQTPIAPLRKKASKLILSPALSDQEKLEIHTSLYGEPRS